MSDPACTPHTPAQPVTDWAPFAFDTRQVHAGSPQSPESGLRIPPIALSAGYVFDDFDDGVARFSGASGEPIYSRQGNPTNAVAESRLASLEGASGCVAVSSGQAAISAALFTLAGQGDHIVSTASIYGGTRILFGRSFARFGINVSYVWDTHDDDAWDRAITPRTKALYAETIPNPRNDVQDLKQLARVAARHHLPLVIDNTVGTPALVRPIEFGANIVVHSTTKFLTGHGASLGGAIVDGGNFDWAAAETAGRSFDVITKAPRAGASSYLERFGAAAYARAAREAVVNDIGPSLSAFNGFLLHQGLETLSLRMERHARSAHQIAHWLISHPEVVSVDYAGLPGNPHHEVALRDYAGLTGSVFGVTVRGGRDGARAFTDGLQLFSRMTGIGDTRSMVLHPRTTTHATFAPEINEQLGISEGLLRLSIGLEDPADLIADLERALERVAKLHA